MNVYFYSKKSRDKITHTLDCHFRIASKNIGWFDTLAEAYAAGYRPCKHCDPLLRLYREEKRRIMSFSRRNALSVFSDVEGYHRQRDVCKDSIVGYLRYVVEHDLYRAQNPLPEREEKKIKRAQAIRNVLMLIESLRMQPAVSV